MTPEVIIGLAIFVVSYALIATEPDVFLLPPTSDLRYQWVVARMAALDHDTMEERVVDAWTMCVPKFLARDYRERTGT